MALESLTAKANVGAGTDALAVIDTASGKAGAVALVNDAGVLVGAATPLPVTMTDAASETTLASLSTKLDSVLATLYNHNAAFVDGSPGQLILGKRRDTDTTLVADGDLNTFNMDEEGRLKVASKPASYAKVTGDISAVAGTVAINCERFSNLVMQVAGTFSAMNCTFEASLNSTNGTDGNWVGVQVARSNANTTELLTGSLSASPAYVWECSVNAYVWFRVRCTARTSGTQTWTLVPGTYATEPVPVIQVTGTQPVSGTVTATVTAGTVNPVVPATPYFVRSAATTNGALILTGTSGVPFFYATNEGASAAYVKLYNKATAPTVGTDVPEMTIHVPAAVGGVPGVANPNMGSSNSARFALGLGISITRNAIFSDTTAVGANEVTVKLSRTV